MAKHVHLIVDGNVYRAGPKTAAKFLEELKEKKNPDIGVYAWNMGRVIMVDKLQPTELDAELARIKKEYEEDLKAKPPKNKNDAGKAPEAAGQPLSPAAQADQGITPESAEQAIDGAVPPSAPGEQTAAPVPTQGTPKVSTGVTPPPPPAPGKPATPQAPAKPPIPPKPAAPKS